MALELFCLSNNHVCLHTNILKLTLYSKEKLLLFDIFNSEVNTLIVN